MATPSLFPQFMKAQSGGVTGGAVTVVVNGVVKNNGLSGNINRASITGSVGKRGITATLGKRGITGRISDGIAASLGNSNLDGDLK